MDQVSEQWLLDHLPESSAFIQNRWKPLEIRWSEENIGLGNGFMSELRRLSVLLLTNGKGGEQVRKHWVLKVPASDEIRRAAELHGGYSSREARVYLTFLKDIQQLVDWADGPRHVVPNVPECLVASADAPVALILEDLTEEEYENVPFEQGLNITEMELALSNLAAFHAAGLALRHHLPGSEDLDQKYPFLFRARANDSTSQRVINASFQKLIDHVTTLPSEEDLKTWLQKETPTMFQIVKLLEPREPLAAVTHADSSIINFLFQRDPTNGEPVSCKMIDFKVCMFSNLGIDVAFLLFSSTEPELRRKHETQLVAFYLDALKSRLRFYGDLGDLTPDTIETAFWNDWNLCRKAAFFHLVMCGLNGFFGYYGQESTRNRFVAVAKDVRTMLDTKKS